MANVYVKNRPLAISLHIFTGNAMLLSYDETWKKLLMHYDETWDDDKKMYKGKGCIVKDDKFLLSKIQPAAINSTMQ